MQSGDVVEVVVVEPVEDGFEGCFDVCEVDDEAVVADGAFDGDGECVGVAVQSSAFVAGWDVRQLVCAVIVKLATDTHGLAHSYRLVQLGVESPLRVR